MFHFWKCKKFSNLAARNFYFLKCEKFFNFRARKFNFLKYRNIFEGGFFYFFELRLKSAPVNPIYYH